MKAIQSVVGIFRGMERNTFDNAHNEDIHMNVCSLSNQQIHDNIQSIVLENGVSETQARERLLLTSKLPMNCSNNMV